MILNFTAARSDTAKKATCATLDLEQRLACLADGGPQAIEDRLAELDREWTAGRATKASLTLRDVLLYPDVVGVQGVETVGDLQALVADVNAGAGAALYSGLPSSPHHAVARRYLPLGQGSVFAVTVRGGRDGARVFTDALRLFTRMTHLGDVRSLVLHPATTTHVLRDDDQLAASGIGPGLLRLSIGLEDPDDLIADLDHALAAVAAADLLSTLGAS